MFSDFITQNKNRSFRPKYTFQSLLCSHETIAWQSIDSIVCPFRPGTQY